MNGLKIAMDGKRAVANNTGLGNYSRLVVDVLSRLYPDNDYRLYVPKIKENPRLTPLLERNNVNLFTPDTAFGRNFSSLWRVNSISKQLIRDNVDLFHGLSNELPLTIKKTSIPTVVTIHDLIFRRIPENYKPIDRKIYDYKFRKAAENADRIIAITECTKRDIVNMYGISEEKIDVVYQGCDDIFSLPISEDTMQEVAITYNLPERYIISVGTVEHRKNQLLTIKSLKHIDDDVHLYIVGRRTKYANQLDRYIEDNGLSDRVHFLQGVPFAHLPALYAMAQFSSYPSRFEGFGIPVIESISSGVPVIAATGSSLEEAGGPGALYVDPDDLTSFVDSARLLLSNESRRREMVLHGKSYIIKFCPDNFAAGIVDTYKKVLNR